MRKKLFITIIALITFTQCSNDETLERDYPIIKMLSLSEKGRNEITITAKIENINNLKIIEHGYTLSTSRVDNLQPIALNGEVNSGIFSTDITLPFTINETYYYVRAYIKTDNLTIFSNELSFITFP